MADWGEGVSGAASGAAAGTAVMPGWGTAIGAGIGFLGGMLGGGAQREAQQEARRRYKRAAAFATPGHLVELTKTLQPLFRELVAHGLGPAFQEEVAKNLAQHGMTGTGVGEAMRNASFAIPETTAFSGAMGEAGNVAGRQVSAELGAPAPQPIANPLISALLGGARGYIAGSNFGGKPGGPAPGVSWDQAANLPAPAGTGYGDVYQPFPGTKPMPNLTPAKSPPGVGD